MKSLANPPVATNTALDRMVNCKKKAKTVKERKRFPKSKQGADRWGVRVGAGDPHNPR